MAVAASSGTMSLRSFPMAASHISSSFFHSQKASFMVTIGLGRSTSACLANSHHPVLLSTFQGQFYSKDSFSGMQLKVSRNFQFCSPQDDRRSAFLVRCMSSDSKIALAEEEVSGVSKSGSSESEGKSGNGATTAETLPLGELKLPQLSSWMQFLVKLRMLTALPWQRVKKGSLLTIRLSGTISEQLGSRFSTVLSIPQISENLRKAASDPRISGLVLKVEPLACGWGKVEEIKRHVELFKQSGKLTLAYMTVGGEKEYYLASSCSEIYTPPGAYISLRGLAVSGQFLGGVLEKAGVQPQIQRIGKYKSAGDQLARKDMSEPNREMLTALLDDIYSKWVSGVAVARGKTTSEVEALLNEGVQEMERLKEGGWTTDVLYESQVEELLKKRLDLPKDKPLRTVDNRKYSRVREWTLGIGGKGDRIAVIRAVGGISRGRSRGTASGIKSDDIISTIRYVKGAKQIKAVVLRIDSPGGDALGSDLMWHEIRELAKVKTVVASMADVAASGGYYMAMAAPIIVAEELTLTGSIGVVTGKFNLGELYQRVGFSKEIISRGRFAEVDADQRPFSSEEEEYFAKGAQKAYQSFRNKAAESRSMEVDQMEEFAQGRVWTGVAAAQRRLVDAVGGMSRAIAIAKQRAGIAEDKPVRLVELSRQQPSLQMLLAGGAQMASMLLGGEVTEVRRGTIVELMKEAFLPDGYEALASGQPQARMDDIFIDGVGQPIGSRAGMDVVSTSLLLSMLGYLSEDNI